MRFLQTCFAMMLLALFVGQASAGDDFAKGDRPGRGEFRQRMLEEFDADGDGELSDDERATAREKMRDRRGKDGAEGRRGGRGGEGPPNPEELFERFDANGDNQLSREEFHKLAESMREHHAQHRRGKGRHGEGHGRRPGPPDGAGDRPGPRGEDGRKFRPGGPLQNPGDRPGGPPRAGSGRRGGGPDGRGGRDFEGRRPPNPDEVFDRFDENEDGQLSREEFGKLSQAMRERHGHHGRDRGKKKGRGRRGSGGKGRPDQGAGESSTSAVEDDSA